MTFGGAFSNHLAATAASGKIMDFKTIGVIRGHEKRQNPTLQFCKDKGMILFQSADQFIVKDTNDFHSTLKNKFGNFIPFLKEELILMLSEVALKF